MKSLFGVYVCMAGGLLLTGAAANARADAWDKKTYVTSTRAIEAPGVILHAGTYVFKLVDSPSNRHIVQILNKEENHVFATNLTIPKLRMTPADRTVITFYEMPGGGPEPIRAWFYPGDTTGQEFLYSRERAREIAAAMKRPESLVATSRQPAAQPATEAAQPVEPWEPALEPPPVAAEAVPAPMPSAAEAAPSPSPVETAQEAAQPASDAAAPQQPTSQPDAAPAQPEMPTTAGNSAAFGLAGACCLAVAVSLRAASRHKGQLRR